MDNALNELSKRDPNGNLFRIRIRRHFMILNLDVENDPMLNIPIANVSRINSLTYSKQLLEQTVCNSERVLSKVK